MVWRSWEAPRTKDGKALPVPIAPQLRPRLEAAMSTAGPLLFPRRDGSMHPSNLRLGRMLRAAIGRAGLVAGEALQGQRRSQGIVGPSLDDAHAVSPLVQQGQG